MSWKTFHHPDISWPVVRRQMRIEFIELLETAALFCTRGGWGLINRHCYPSDTAYRSALSRLKTDGLIVRQQADLSTPHLILTDEAKQRIPSYFSPEKFWNRSWNGRWYLLTYDVPEKDRAYRNVLRRFLQRKRMGCLHKSVWITPEDIRPDFDDLSKAADIESFAYLFESRTVLGMPAEQIVSNAWNCERLKKIQAVYSSVTEKNIELLQLQRHAPDDLTALLRLSLNGYHSAMAEDPLLPRQLHPRGYLGENVYTLHRTLLSEIDQQLACCS